jgi:hypothetical protein
MLGRRDVLVDYSLRVNPTWIEKAEHILDIIQPDKPICIVKYPTLRKEWLTETRLPKVEYIQLLLDRCKGEYYFISVADIARGVDDYYGDLKGIDLRLDVVDIWVTVGLVYLSDMVIAWPSFFLPLCIALRRNAFFIFGGYCKPEHYVNWRMDLSHFGQVSPIPFCDCFKHRHNCNKEIEEERIIEGFEATRSVSQERRWIAN